MSKAESKAREGWADHDDDDGDEDTGKEIGQASTTESKPEREMGTKSLEAPEPKKDYGPPEARERNAFGDFVVTKIVIPDLKPAVKEEEQQESEEEESSDEPEPVEESKDESAKKKEPVKKLSKAEQKKLEDEEFERVFKEMNVQAQVQKPDAATKEAPKQEENKETDAKKAAANKKKKEKAKAKKAEEDDKKPKAEELTEEQRKQAALDALKKR